MAKLPTINTLRKEDMPDAPEWMGPLITQLNSFMSSVYYALDRDITFDENIAASLKQISFTTRSDYTSASPVTAGFEVKKIFNPLKSKPVGVHLVKIVDLTAYKVITNPVTIHWDYLDGYVNIRYVTGLADSNKYEINLLIL
jgi:hypothetical protein